MEEKICQGQTSPITLPLSLARALRVNRIVMKSFSKIYHDLNVEQFDINLLKFRDVLILMLEY